MNQYYYYQKRGDIEFVLMNYQEWEKDHYSDFKNLRQENGILEKK